MSRYSDWNYYPPYVSVAEKKARNEKMYAKLVRKNPGLKPVFLDGSAIARTFWGKAWCSNVESYQDYSNRLPRGRSYVRSNAVLDLRITRGQVNALVAGSSSKPYSVSVRIAELPEDKWAALKAECTGRISSLISLIQGKLPDEILEKFCHRDTGLFPSPAEIHTSCSCPDSAGLCKHLAAVFYAIGSRLDEMPELFFTLRGIDPAGLIGSGLVDSLTSGANPEIASENIGNIFGIEFDAPDEHPAPVPAEKPEPVKNATPQSLPVSCEWTPDQIRAFRKSAGLTQKDFGKLLDTSNTTICFWEKGWSKVPLGVRKKLDQLKAKLSSDKEIPDKAPAAVPGTKAHAPARKSVWSARKVKMLRKQSGLSKFEFGKLVGVSDQTVSNWESGKSRIREKYFSKLDQLKLQFLL